MAAIVEIATFTGEFSGRVEITEFEFFGTEAVPSFVEITDFGLGVVSSPVIVEITDFRVFYVPSGAHVEITDFVLTVADRGPMWRVLNDDLEWVPVDWVMRAMTDTFSWDAV